MSWINVHLYCHSPSVNHAIACLGHCNSLHTPSPHFPQQSHSPHGTMLFWSPEVLVWNCSIFPRVNPYLKIWLTHVSKTYPISSLIASLPPVSPTAPSHSAQPHWSSFDSFSFLKAFAHALCCLPSILFSLLFGLLTLIFYVISYMWLLIRGFPWPTNLCHIIIFKTVWYSL